MCALFQEDGTETVMEILGKSHDQPEQDDAPVIVPFIALMETEYWLLRRFSTREAGEALFLVENWPVEVQESSSDWRHEAARVKATARRVIHYLLVGSSEYGRIQGSHGHIVPPPDFARVRSARKGPNLPGSREDYRRCRLWERQDPAEVRLDRPGPDPRFQRVPEKPSFPRRTSRSTWRRALAPALPGGQPNAYRF